MTITFVSKIRKYNKKGVGFVYLPKEHKNKFKIGQQLKISIKLSNNKIDFFAKLRTHHKEGIYIPASVTKKNDLTNQEATINIKKIDGFFSKTSYDGRIYIPQKQAQELRLKQDEIVLIEGKINEKTYKEFCRIKIRKKPTTIEYFCMFNPRLRNKKGIFNIKSFLSRNIAEIPIKTKGLINDFNYASISQNQIVMYYGNRMPIVINADFNLEEIAHYLGCYFADGTKRGNDWGICASTFKQARYYLKLHHSLILDNNVVPSISFTDIKNQDKSILRKKLTNKWTNKTDIEVKESRVRIINSDCDYSRKTNPFGSLVFKEHRQLTQIYYNKLLNYLFEIIEKNNNQELALDFILGTLEGDGCVGVAGDLRIYSNLMELEILKNTMVSTPFSFSSQIDGKNKGHIFIGSLEIIRNMPLLKDKLFKYYPKRRKILQERLANTGCAKYLLYGRKTSNVVIGRLKKHGILDKNRKLTDYGEKVKMDLKEFVEKV